MSNRYCLLLSAVIGLFAGACLADDVTGNAYEAPPAIRPLPTASHRPMGNGPAFFVDASKGNDASPGSLSSPFKTMVYAISKLKPGDTLYLRGGTYYEQIDTTLSGEKNRPITIRAYPNELVILDAGIRDFVDHPETAWEPNPDGGPDEYRSVKTYEAQGDTRPVNTPGAVNVMGSFADTMVPLQGYWSSNDLRTNNELWTLAGAKKLKNAPATEKAPDANVDPESIYCGPGILYDPATKYIYARFSHTNNTGLGEANYNGETDPRKLRLIISRPGRGGVLHFEESHFLNIEDLVCRGSRAPTITFEDSSDINLDGLTVYSGQSCLQASYTRRAHVNNCAFRGIAAPWTFRSSLKYRSVEARIISLSGWIPSGNADFEFENSEFTDSVDGVFIGNVKNVKFHHNLVSNISDDCFFLTATSSYDGKTEGGNIQIYQNYISRTLTVFAFGVGHGRQRLTENGRQLGHGVWFYRNVVDNREWIPYFPHKTDEEYEYDPVGRMAGDHGSPTWEPLFVYHNTIIAGSPAFRDYYLDGLSSAVGPTNKRRLIDNIFVQMKGMPGMVFPNATADLETATNLHWSLADGPGYQGDLFARFRSGKTFGLSKSLHPPGWTIGDVLADPKFQQLTGDLSAAVDLRLQDGSPAIDAGVDVPKEWPDPLRDQDKAKPDLGAIPAGVEPWTIGINQRNKISGLKN